MMSGNSDRAHRFSLRLKGYDYTREGAYFVTVCSHGRTCLFGEVSEGHMELGAAGRMVQEVWDALPEHYPAVGVDAFVIMPNHVHGVILLDGVSTLSLGDVIHRFKTLTTKRYSDGVSKAGWPAFSGRLWQRNYYEHIIRDEASLSRIRKYIAENPSRWAEDSENPDCSRPGGGSSEWARS